MEPEIRKYLAFITLLIASFLLVNHYSTRIQPRQDLYWPVSVQSLSVRCGVCGTGGIEVTERDFGHLREGWDK